ncbi:hypothetical protein H0H81_012762 [Sphagnurus paluster]|uniref:RAD50-interacting protein 1 n=1 Tax=Sphagnurus paluster TaxID=117069 RepID=A0A9P7GIF0_9AGAR|nr:hypothetical protein H0H81_012762 [Sphagnurus paluster]
MAAQLASSQLKIDTLIDETHVCASAHINTAQELSLLRHSLTDELAELSEELISTFSEGTGKSTLLEDIETLHRNLKELHTIKSYVQVIEHALKLSEASLERIRSSQLSISASSLCEYQTLQSFVSELSEAFSKVEDGPGDQIFHLVQFLEKVREKTWAGIQGIMARGDNIRVPQVSQKRGNSGLYAIQALVQPISLRFRYHFEGTRQTNRLDKPEWYFTHILNVVHEHRTFMQSVVQRLLENSEYKQIDAWHEFTYLLLPILSRKLKKTVPLLLPHPSLLAHTIYQALTFDAALAQEGFLIQGTSASNKSSDKWEGASEVILGNAEWFESWLLGEQKFAEDQYHDAISAADAWLIAIDDVHEDEVHSRDVKSTNSARRICSLIEQVTDRYSPLPRFGQRTRFLLSVQLPILSLYHARITSSLDAFEALSSAFVRTVPGALNFGGKDEGSIHVDNRGLTSGVEGVQRLCKALLSAKYVESVMRGWGEDLFFLELWTEINHNPELRDQVIPSPFLPNPQAAGNEIPGDTLFEEMISRYERLANRSEDMVVHQICGEIESLLKAHFSLASPNPNFDHTDDIALAQTLLAPIALLSSHLTFLRMNMSQATLTILYRRITSRLADHILQRQILYRGNFAMREGKSIRTECELWVETCRAALGGSLPSGRAGVEAPWMKLLQAACLASAEGDTWVAFVETTFGTSNDDDWEFAMEEALGSVELGREEVVRVLRRREDCDR